jgi:thiamine phosphate synthase YjbQ (UPF0047 family)
MPVHTDDLFFATVRRQEFVRITEEVEAIVRASGIREGMALVSAMRIAAGVFAEHPVIVPITAGRLQLGLWEQLSYAKCERRLKSRVGVEAMGG